MKHYYMINKPFGCVSACSDDRYPTVMSYFADLNNPELMHVGRLDRETTGLLLVTDDGSWCQRMINPQYNKEKTYHFTAMGELSGEKCARLASGVQLRSRDRLTRPAKVEGLEFSTLSEVMKNLEPEIQRKIAANRPEQVTTSGLITVTEGVKHQIRRMLKAEGCFVIALHRVSVGPIWLDENLKPGEFRELTMEEMRLSGALI